MNRRPFLQYVATGGVVTTAGCASALLSASDDPDPDDVFASYRYDRGDLVVEFRDDADVDRALLYDSSSDEEHDYVDGPAGTVRFPVVFPNRLETYVTARPGLRVRAETDDGVARLSVWEPVHGVARTVEPIADGRARLEIENQGEGPLLVAFLGITGDVPNPTVDVQADEFDRASFDRGPGVVGVAENRPLSPTRSDLVVHPGDTRPFETTYSPFAFPDGVDATDCDGGERTGTVAVLHGSGGSAAYGFTYRLDGDPESVDGRPDVGVCVDQA